ncbi:MAG: polyhydroxyalkanoic acid system family protein [Pseudomonadota bacterium]
MSNIHISRKHNLDHDECLAVAEDLLDQLVSAFGGRVSRDGNCYNYRHTTGLRAVIEPKEGELDINVKLNLMTRSFGPQVEQQINEVLDEHIGTA